MLEQILQAVKTSFSKYGLKPESREKIANIVKQSLEAMGTIEPEKLQTTIEAAVKAAEPFVAVIQSEVDARALPTPIPTTTPIQVPAPSPAPAPVQDPALKAIMDKLTALEAKDQLAVKAAAKKSLTDSAKAAAKLKGASNDAILDKAMRLVDVSDGMTQEQLVDKAILEYNELYTATSANGAIPAIPTNTLSAAEIEKNRTSASDKAAEEFKKNNTNI